MKTFLWLAAAAAVVYFLAKRAGATPATSAAGVTNTGTNTQAPSAWSGIGTTTTSAINSGQAALQGITSAGQSLGGFIGGLFGGSSSASGSASPTTSGSGSGDPLAGGTTTDDSGSDDGWDSMGNP